MRSVKKVLGTALALTASIAMLAGGAPVALAADVAGDIPIDASHFPDKALRACVINPNSGVPIDTDEDGMLSVAERNAVTSFSCYGGVDSTQGLELFPNLTDLSIEDVSSVDVSKNPKLTSLSLLSGSFASLDVSHNLQLKELNLDGGKLTSVDVSHNPELTKLSVYSNPLSSLDVSHNPKLTELNVQESALASVDVSKNPLLEILHLRDNKLTSLDVTHNPKLIELFASNNALSSLDVSKNPALVQLDADKNKLTSLDVSRNPKLENLFVSSNRLTKLDTTHNPTLYAVHASNNELTSLDVPNSSKLVVLEASNNKLQSLDVSHNTRLVSLVVKNNAITVLDLSKNVNLVESPSTRSAAAVAREVQLDGNPLVALRLPAGYRNAQQSDVSAATYQAAYTGSTFDLSSVASWFDGAKVSDLKGAKLDGTTLTGLSGTADVTYTYDTGAAEMPLKAHVKLTKSAVVAPSFADVNAGTPHADDIKWLASTGISTGWKEKDGTTTYRGMNSVVRQDMAAFLYRLAGSPAFDVSKAENPFKDVTAKTPHYKEILWLASTGISTGWTEKDGSKTFRGMDSVKRQDMAAFLHRLASHEKANPTLGEPVPFRDVTMTTPHLTDVEWLARTGVTTGWKEKDGSRTFRGMNPVVRQDMAAFLHRMSANVLK